jgi:hypothetical protein
MRKPLRWRASQKRFGIERPEMAFHIPWW